MLFLRHGDATQDEFGIDLLRPLSEKGRKQAEEVIFPIELSEITEVAVSPAVRTMQTIELAAPGKPIIVIPSLYAPNLLPEISDMYKEYGENTRAYLNDPRIIATMALTRQSTMEIRQLCRPKSLIGAHFLILNLIAYHMYGIEKILDINLRTAKGFWVNDGDVIEF